MKTDTTKTPDPAETSKEALFMNETAFLLHRCLEAALRLGRDLHGALEAGEDLGLLR